MWGWDPWMLPVGSIHAETPCDILLGQLHLAVLFLERKKETKGVPQKTIRQSKSEGKPRKALRSKRNEVGRIIIHHGLESSKVSNQQQFSIWFRTRDQAPGTQAKPSYGVRTDWMKAIPHTVIQQMAVCFPLHLLAKNYPPVAQISHYPFIHLGFAWEDILSVSGEVHQEPSAQARWAQVWLADQKPYLRWLVISWLAEITRK